MSDNHNHQRPARSTMDLHQIFKHSFDEHTGALRTVPSVDSHFSISLNAQEDSITSVRKDLVVTDGEITSCIGIRSVCCFGQTKIEISPSDEGDEWYVVSDNASGIGPIVQICARRIKATGPGKVVGQG